MIIKLIISFIIIGCSTLIGWIYANSFIDRTKLLASLLSTLQMLETEIVYSATPLPELLRKVGRKSRKEIREILLTVSEDLNRKEGLLFSEVWELVVEEQTKATSFIREDIDLLIELGKNLGLSNSSDQIKYIHLAMEELKRNYDISLMEQRKNVKLYRNLGFLLGVTIVIILF